VLRDVARQAADLRGELAERAPARRAVVAGQPGDLLGDAARVPLGQPREPLELGERQAERLADVADRAAAPVGGEAGDERRVLAADALGYRDYQLLGDVAGHDEVVGGHAAHLVV
jgi:hypothetical protein